MFVQLLACIWLKGRRRQLSASHANRVEKHGVLATNQMSRLTDKDILQGEIEAKLAPTPRYLIEPFANAARNWRQWDNFVLSFGELANLSNRLFLEQNKKHDKHRSISLGQAHDFLGSSAAGSALTFGSNILVSHSATSLSASSSTTP